MNWNTFISLIFFLGLVYSSVSCHCYNKNKKEVKKIQNKAIKNERKKAKKKWSRMRERKSLHGEFIFFIKFSPPQMNRKNCLNPRLLCKGLFLSSRKLLYYFFQ